MKKVLVLMLVLFIFTLMTKTQSTEKIETPIVYHQEPRLSCKYYNESEFAISLKPSGLIRQIPSKIRGGIVPHHLLANRLIAEFFQVLSAHPPKVLVVIGPNHKGIGKKQIHTGSWAWDTPYGILNAENSIVDYLKDNKIADTNFHLLENEHSISGLVPFIKYYLPDTKIVPVLLHGSLRLSESVKLGNSLIEALNRNLSNTNETFAIISSVDFSHYLSVQQADKMDKLTLKVLENRDIKVLNKLGNDYLDSPPSIISLLTAMDKAGAFKHTVLEHNNSARISSTDPNYTTSYITVLYHP